MRGKKPLADLALVLAALAAAAALAARYLWVRGLPLGGGGVPYAYEEGGPPAGNERCLDCHEGIGETQARGPHRALPCGECHAPLELHVREEEKVADMPPLRRITLLCSRCHRDLEAARRRESSLHFELHVVEVGAIFSDRVCFDCHPPHDPRP